MLDLYLVGIGGLALALGLASRKLHDLPLSEPLAALGLGVLLGPAVLGLVEIPEAERDTVLATAARISLALSLMAVALRFPLATVRAHLPALAWLLSVGMLGMAAISTGLGVLAFGLPLATAALLGAALAPTDPVVSSAIVEGEAAERDLPERLRAIISAESGLNDGLAWPLVVLGVAAVLGETLAGGAARGLASVAVAVAIGAVAGLVAGRLLVVADRHRDVEHSAFLALTLSLTVFVLGLTELAGGSGLLAVLVAGFGYNHAISAAERKEEWEVQDAVNRFLVLPVFTLLGVALPWAAWQALGWRGPAFAAAVLALRRLPLVLALRRPLRFTGGEALFVGWFGPVGIAALYLISHAGELGAAPPPLWTAGSLVIAASTVVHGVTGAPGRRLFAHRERRVPGAAGGSG